MYIATKSAAYEGGVGRGDDRPGLDEGHVDGAPAPPRPDVEGAGRPQQGDAVRRVVRVERLVLQERHDLCRQLKVLVPVGQHVRPLAAARGTERRGKTANSRSDGEYGHEPYGASMFSSRHGRLQQGLSQTWAIQCTMFWRIKMPFFLK